MTEVILEIPCTAMYDYFAEIKYGHDSLVKQDSPNTSKQGAASTLLGPTGQKLD